jgi:hypothetical protein
LGPPAELTGILYIQNRIYYVARKLDAHFQ